jgi:hypothetical protein
MLTINAGLNMAAVQLSHCFKSLPGSPSTLQRDSFVTPDDINEPFSVRVVTIQLVPRAVTSHSFSTVHTWPARFAIAPARLAAIAVWTSPQRLAFLPEASHAALKAAATAVAFILSRYAPAKLRHSARQYEQDLQGVGVQIPRSLHMSVPSAQAHAFTF